MILSKITVEQLNAMNKDTLMEALGIEFIAVGDDYVKAKMPVDHRTRQPYGILHGGASVALAETIGSVASHFYLEKDKLCVGLEVNANHLRTVREGFVIGTGKPLHTGRSTHVWEIRIENERQQLVCISRLTMAVIDKK